MLTASAARVKCSYFAAAWKYMSCVRSTGGLALRARGGQWHLLCQHRFACEDTEIAELGIAPREQVIQRQGRQRVDFLHQRRAQQVRRPTPIAVRAATRL